MPIILPAGLGDIIKTEMIKSIKENNPKPDIETLQAELDEYFASVSNTEDEN